MIRVMEVTACIECPNCNLNSEEGHRCALHDKPLQDINADVPDFCCLETVTHFLNRHVNY